MNLRNLTGCPSVLSGMNPRSLFPIVALLTACRSVSSTAETRLDTSAPRTDSKVTARPGRASVGNDPGGLSSGQALAAKARNELAAFAGGCFWGVEDTFRQVPGVVATAVGFTGGHTKAPSYEQVCTHTTGHAEAVLIEFDPTKITYEELLVVFLKNHDPTTRNRQGPDIGDQYRSAIFAFSPEQDAKARAALATEEASRGKKVVTEVATIGTFYKAEEYHQQYDEKTGTHSCPIPKGLPKGEVLHRGKSLSGERDDGRRETDT